MNTDNDYDNDGNNIVPCPICYSAYCLSKEKGKCPKEDDFIKEVEARNTTINYESIREAIDKLQGIKSEPLINKISANKETVDVIKKQFPSRLKDYHLTYMYGIQVSEINYLEYGVVKIDFNDGSYKFIRIANK